MYYKLALETSKEDIEKEFNLSFKHPHLYEPQLIVNGLDESNLWFITEEDRNIIDLGIWGIMPKDYLNNWQEYQKKYNTLAFNYSSLQNSLNQDIFAYKKCLIVVSGFFASFLHAGQVYTYYVYESNKRPIFIAGIYNCLKDGFCRAV